jgi:PAS domain S-box-containing protein
MSDKLRAEHLLAAILSSTEDALLSFALDGTIQTWSRGAERLYGYRAAEIAGQPLGRLLATEDAPKYEGRLHAAIQGEFPQCENAQRRHKDGSMVRVPVSRAPIRNERGDLTAILEHGKALPGEGSEAGGKGNCAGSSNRCP